MIALPPLPEWTPDAACDGIATRDFDPWHEPEHYPIAKRVCAQCDVAQECRAWAVTELVPRGIAQGVYGGLEPAQLRALAAPARGPRAAAAHGTRARYLTCTAGADGSKCAACRAANASYEHQRRRDRARTPGPHPAFAVLDHPTGRGQHRAWPGQLLLFADTA